MIQALIVYGIFGAFIAWVVYVQITGWKRTKGYPIQMQMSTIDRFHEEVVYQVCYKRGYWLDLEMNDDGFWAIKDTNYPNHRILKLIVFMAMLHVAANPFSFRTVNIARAIEKGKDIKPFDDYDPAYQKPQVMITLAQ